MKLETDTVDGANPVCGAAQQPAADREMDLDALRRQQRGASCRLRRPDALRLGGNQVARIGLARGGCPEGVEPSSSAWFGYES